MKEAIINSPRANVTVQELREMIANLRLVKDFYDPEERIVGLGNESEIDLTTYELLLENHLEDKLIKNIKL